MAKYRNDLNIDSDLLLDHFILKPNTQKNFVSAEGRYASYIHFYICSTNIYVLNIVLYAGNTKEP